MGCCASRLDRQEMVSRCRARKRYMKQLVQARQCLSVAHSFYVRSLRSTGSSLLQFATNESSLLRYPMHSILSPNPNPQPLPPTPPPPPSISPSTDTWTTTTASSAATTTTSALPPPPPPPPPASNSTWDFWDPFAGRREEEEWADDEDDVSGTVTTSEVTVTPPEVRVAASVAAPPSVVSGFSNSKESEMAVVVSRQGKELVEIIKELDEYFLRAADAASCVSGVLEVPTFSNPHHLPPYSSGKVMNWSGMTWNGFGLGKIGDQMVMGGGKGNGMMMGMVNNNNGGLNFNVINAGMKSMSHCSTVERLYAWEKKLFLEVKNAEKIRMEHEKRVEQLRRLEVKRSDYMKTEKTKKEVEKLESQMLVAAQAIETTSNEIIKLRESELYPQLLDLAKGFMCMWRSMYECHQVQTHIVDQLKFLNAIASLEPTSEIHRQSTLQLEMELQQWHQSFCNLVKAQRDYIHSLAGWLRLSLFQFNKNPIMRTIQDSTIYSLCEQWQVAIDNVPDKVASEGIKSLLTVVHAIVVLQADEHKQKKKMEAANKELEKKAAELRSLEAKHGQYSMPERNGRDPVGEKRAKVEMLKAKAEEEKGKHDKAVGVSRGMTLNNMQMGLPHVFQAITGFSSVCTHAFESVYNKAKIMDEENGVKRLMIA